MNEASPQPNEIDPNLPLHMKMGESEVQPPETLADFLNKLDEEEEKQKEQEEKSQEQSQESNPEPVPEQISEPAPEPQPTTEPKSEPEPAQTIQSGIDEVNPEVQPDKKAEEDDEEFEPPEDAPVLEVGNNKFKFLEKVKIVRTSGDMEDDWRISGVDQRGVTAIKTLSKGKNGKFITKTVPVDEFLSWQKPETGPRSKLEKDGILYVGGEKFSTEQNVNVVRTNGDIENDWRVVSISGGGGGNFVTVQKEEGDEILQKKVRVEDFLSWQKPEDDGPEMPPEQPKQEGREPADDSKSETEKRDALEWEKSEERQNLEDMRADWILMQEDFKLGKISQEVLNASSGNYKHALDTAAIKIKEILKREAGENLSMEKEAELRLKTNNVIFDELIEKENKSYLDALRNERSQTIQDKIIEGSKNVKNALTGRLMNWYSGLSGEQKISLNFGTAGLSNLLLGSIEEVQQDKAKEIEELRNSNAPVRQRAENLSEIEDRYKKEKVKNLVTKMKGTAVDAGIRFFEGLANKAYSSSETTEPIEPIAEEKNTIDPEALRHKVEEGDTVWEILRKTLTGNERFMNMMPAQKMYVLNDFTAKIFKEPATYGLQEDGTIRIGDHIDLTKLFEDDEEMISVFDEAEKDMIPGSTKESGMLDANKEAVARVTEMNSRTEKMEKDETEPAHVEVSKPETVVNQTLETVEIKEPEQVLSKTTDLKIEDFQSPDEAKAAAEPMKQDFPDKNQLEQEIEAAKQRLSELEGGKNAGEATQNVRNPSLERSLPSDAALSQEVERAFRAEIDSVYGKKGIFSRVEGVNTKEWGQMARLPASKVVEYYTGDSAKSGLPLEVTKSLDKVNNHSVLMNQVAWLMDQSKGAVKPFDNENMEQFIKRLGGYVYKTNLSKAA